MINDLEQLTDDELADALARNAGLLASLIQEKLSGQQIAPEYWPLREMQGAMMAERRRRAGEDI